MLSYQRERDLASKASTRSFTIGVIDSHPSRVLRPVSQCARLGLNRSLSLVHLYTHQDPARGLSYLDQLVAKNVDGIIVAGAMVPSEIEAGINGQPPIVFADFPGAPGPSVLFDHEQGSALATAHMLEHGHRRIGFIAPPRELPSAAPNTPATNVPWHRPESLSGPS